MAVNVLIIVASALILWVFICGVLEHWPHAESTDVLATAANDI